MASYSITVTGDCSNTNSGVFNLNIEPGSGPYLVSWTNNTFSPQITSQNYVQTGLSAGSYSITITDSSLPVNVVTGPILFYISSGFSLNISNVIDTTCGISNGSITLNSSSNYGNTNVDLYFTNENGITNRTQTIQLSELDYTVSNLTNGTYYFKGIDEGGCACNSQTAIVRNSSNFDFGLFVVDTNSCGASSGKLYVTGLTGTPPFTYQWAGASPIEQNNDYATGLTEGFYSCSIEDSTGCVVSRSATISMLSSMSLSNYTIETPTCVGNDGSLTVYLNGGTPPYYCILSNGEVITTLNTAITFSNLVSTTYQLNITDATLCKLNLTIPVISPNSFNIYSVTTTNSNCSYRDGKITILMQDGVPPYTARITKNGGNTQTLVSYQSEITFQGLESGTYDLDISDSLSLCSYSSGYTINNVTEFTSVITTTGTTCSNDNGVLRIQTTPSTTATTYYNYTINNGFSSGPTYVTDYYFTGLTVGNYTVVVQNSNNCIESYDFVISQGNTAPNITLLSTGCGTGSGGTISLIIDGGQYPYTIEWGSNISGQTGTFLTGLTSDFYEVTVTDANGCQDYASTEITCPQRVASSQSINVGGIVSKTTKTNGLTIYKMLSQTFASSISDAENCILTATTFTAKAILDGIEYTNEFYNGTSIDDYPTDELWESTTESLLSSVYGVASVDIDIVTNSVVITSEQVGGVDVLANKTLYYYLTIDCESSCQFSGGTSC